MLKSFGNTQSKVKAMAMAMASSYNGTWSMGAAEGTMQATIDAEFKYITIFMSGTQYGNISSSYTLTETESHAYEAKKVCTCGAQPACDVRIQIFCSVLSSDKMEGRFKNADGHYVTFDLQKMRQ